MKLFKRILLSLFFVFSFQNADASDSTYVTELRIELHEWKCVSKGLKKGLGMDEMRTTQSTTWFAFKIEKGGFHSKEYFTSRGPRNENYIKRKRKWNKKINLFTVNQLLDLVNDIEPIGDIEIDYRIPNMKKVKSNSYSIHIITNENDTIKLNKSITVNNQVTVWSGGKSANVIRSRKLDLLFLSFMKKQFVGVRRLKRTL